MFRRIKFRLESWIREQLRAVIQSEVSESLSGLEYSFQRLVRLQDEQQKENRGLLVKIEQLQWFQGAMDSSGIRRKFGGNIDCDFDKFIGSLDEHGRKELMKSLRGWKG